MRRYAGSISVAVVKSKGAGRRTSAIHGRNFIRKLLTSLTRTYTRVTNNHMHKNVQRCSTQWHSIRPGVVAGDRRLHLGAAEEIDQVRDHFRCPTGARELFTNSKTLHQWPSMTTNSFRLCAGRVGCGAGAIWRATLASILADLNACGWSAVAMVACSNLQQLCQDVLVNQISQAWQPGSERNGRGKRARLSEIQRL